jgi:hypothetical protein
MNPQENRDQERRLQELGAQLDKERLLSSGETQPDQPFTLNRSSAELVLNQVVNWFNSLPSAGKVAVVVVAAFVGFSLLRTVFQLVASLISLAILGVILYLVYKFLITPQSPK